MPWFFSLLMFGGLSWMAWYFFKASVQQKEDTEALLQQANVVQRGVAPVEGQGLRPPPIDLNHDRFGQIAERFVQAHGGRVQMENIKTLGMQGKFFLGEETYDLYMVKRPPDGLFLQVQKDDLKQLTVSGPDGVFVARYIDGQVVQLNELTGTRAHDIRDQATIMTPFARLCVYEDGVFEQMEGVDYAGVSAVRIDFSLEGTRCYAILDRENYWVLEYGETQAGGRSRRVEMRDYRVTSRTWLPFKIQIFVNDRPTFRVELERVNVNIGILSDYFRRPDYPGAAPLDDALPAQQSGPTPPIQAGAPEASSANSR